MVQFEEVVAQFGPALARVAASYAYGAAEREDLLQDILLAVWRALPRFAGRSSLRTYVFRIAHNRGLSLARARKPVHACDSEQLRPDPSPDPEQRAVMSDERARLLRAVAELPIGQRQVLTLVLEGLTHQEVGDVLGLAEDNVSMRLSRARQALKATLEKDHGG